MDMGIQDLKQQQENINQQMLAKITQDTRMLKTLADDMAESATNIQGQGYVAFVQSREKFLAELHRVADENSFLVCPKSSREPS